MPPSPTCSRHGIGVAAFIADSIFSSDGVFAGPAGFLRPIVEEIHAVGGLYIADEVQPGFGRTGEEWWGFQRHGIVPDIVTIGKPMGNGIPISAAVFKPELLVEFGKNIRYFNTFGGNSVAIAAAQAVLDVIREESLMENALKVGAKIQTELRGTHSRSGSGCRSARKRPVHRSRPRDRPLNADS